MPRIAMPRMRSNDVTRSFWETGADREVVFDIVVAFGDRVLGLRTLLRVIKPIA